MQHGPMCIYTHIRMRVGPGRLLHPRWAGGMYNVSKRKKKPKGEGRTFVVLRVGGAHVSAHLLVGFSYKGSWRKIGRGRGRGANNLDKTKRSVETEKEIDPPQLGANSLSLIIHADRFTVSIVCSPAAGPVSSPLGQNATMPPSCLTQGSCVCQENRALPPFAYTSKRSYW